MAEIVLKELGTTIAPRGSTAAGALVVREELAAAEIPLEGVRIADGSGLSMLDRLTVQALVAILRSGASDPSMRDAFVTSLAVAGISGTMKRRLAERPTRSRVIAKTGTTNAASALAGFVRRRYVFAILQNGAPVPYWTARLAQDRFVTLLAAPSATGVASRARRRIPSRASQPLRTSALGGRPPRAPARRASPPSAPSSPETPPTITPVVFFETESETFAPSASSAAFASSRFSPRASR